jgi:LemA protein
MPPLFWVALAGLAVALFLLWRSNADDQKNWIVERATPLSIALVNPRDDVWIRGELSCTDPLVVPNFDLSCVFYRYQEEEQVTRHTSRGTTTRWETRFTDSRRVDFDIVEENARISILAEQADFDGLSQCGPEEYAVNRRRSARFFPYPVKADAVGSVSDDRRRLERYGNIPLIVTTRTRTQFIAACERRETWMRWLGGVLLLIGVSGVLLGLSLRFDYPPVLETGLPVLNILASFGAGLFIFVSWWIGYTHNRLVMCRERVETAWRHIDIDLKNRHDLIPELVAAIKGYAEHEREIAEILTQLRYAPDRGVGLDRRASAAVPLDGFWAVVERYPALKANQLFAQLQRQLTALEEKIAFGRQFYNDSLLEYNNLRTQFPARAVARLFPRFPVYEPFGSWHIQV